ncbi:hypothetical protein F5879DRAFT_166947 [Lentinula edodes]|nr:hypothetical protein F5879DRAFT_166947 [Lentinula edodes]
MSLQHWSIRSLTQMLLDGVSAVSCISSGRTVIKLGQTLRKKGGDDVRLPQGTNAPKKRHYCRKQYLIIDDIALEDYLN